MKFAFRLLPRGIEENVFKAVPGGWVLNSANPWLFGPSRNYFVTDEQKPAIAAKVRRKFYGNVIAAVVAVELAAVAGVKFPWLLSLSPKAFFVWAAAFAAYCAVSALIERLIMGPIVRELPRTSEKVGMIDRWIRMSESMSMTSVVFFTVFGAVCAAINLYIALGEGRLIGWAGAPFMAFLTMGYGYVLALKLRGKSAVDAG